MVDAASGAPAGLVERVQFAGGSLFTLGSDELSAGSGVWQFAVIGATATGVVFVTLAISFFVPVPQPWPGAGSSVPTSHRRAMRRKGCWGSHGRAEA